MVTARAVSQHIPSPALERDGTELGGPLSKGDLGFGVVQRKNKILFFWQFC